MKRNLVVLIGALFMFAASTLAFAQNADLQSFSSGNKLKYSTKYHPKAKGINITVEYPSHWKLSEGERPNIVQKFSGDASDGITRMFLILIKDIPSEASAMSTEDIAKEAFSEDALKEMVPPGGSFIKGGQTKYDGQPGAWIIVSIDSERAGMKGKSYGLLHMFIYGGKMISIQCMVGGLEQMSGNLYQEFNSYIPLFQQIGNSIIVPDKWTKNDVEVEQSPMEYLYGPIWWLTIIVSFVLTWGIGLIPPILIRYAIVRKPLSRGWAIGLVAFLWMVNIVIFTALGSQSKTHAALFLVAWTSYIILKKEKRPAN